MLTFRRNSDSALFAAVTWAGNFADITAFLAANPPLLHPKVTEDNPAAIGITLLPSGDLAVYGIDGTPIVCHLTDSVLRAATDHWLSVVTAATLASSFTLVP